MEAPKQGNGADFDPSLPYRMYHGERIPGFPRHPHRGMETITCTMQGLIDHTDSLGNGGRYGNGDLQWMTAGQGIQHAEMFPLLNQDKPNPCRFFQLWLNLPKSSKMVPSTQVMHWKEDIPHFIADGVDVTIWAGEYKGLQALAPPKHSWASYPHNHVTILFIKLSPYSQMAIPACAKELTRTLYCISDFTMKETKLQINNEELKVDSFAFLNHDELILKNGGGQDVYALFMQGRPIDEPIVQNGPFVMNTNSEIMQAYMDYRTTQFGGWPWEEDGPVFARDRDRFLKIKGVEQQPSK